MAEYKIYLLTEQMQTHIDGVIDSIFIKLVTGHKKYIKLFTIYLIDCIGCKLGFTKSTINDFFRQLSQNQSRDIISIMYLLLPYIDDADNYQLYKLIVKLEDITCKKKSKDIFSNNYMISNFQFSRYVDANQTNKDYIEYLNNISFIKDADGYYEYKYSVYDLEISFKLVLATIDQVISRLYVNWINIIPITLSDYKLSSKYKQSMEWNPEKKKFMCPSFDGTEPYEFNFWNLDLDSKLRAYGGIGAGDVFNTIYVFLFGEIYKSGVKWLLYEKQESGKKSIRPTMYIEMINSIVPIQYLYSRTIYDLIDIKKRKKIEIQWNKIITEVISNPFSEYANFIKLLVVKFDQKFCNDEIAEEYSYDYKELYKSLEKVGINDTTVDDDNLLESEDNIMLLDLTKIDYGKELYLEYINKLKSFVILPFEVIYEFLTEQIQKFKLTWYGKNIIKVQENKVIIDPEVKFNSNPDANKTIINGITYYPTYKNIYNYAKSIAIKFMGVPVNGGVQVADARNLSPEQKQQFIKIINREETTNFNIGNVLRKTYGSIIPVQQIQQYITEYFLSNLKDIVFTSWIQLGLLNRFEIDSSITDENLLGESETVRKVNIKKLLKEKFDKPELKSILTDSYYYLTGDKYSNLEIYNKKGKESNWFELTFEENEPWYYAFAMNWVSQINFLHHFISNRVIFVTGATGQGKSTEVPKLLYYAVKAVNLNFSARVVSTQPTVIPTIKNAKIISTNLGVPIEINNYPTTSSYLQYSTQDKKHLITGSQTYIKEVTDRTLFEEIIQNPYLKRFRDTKNKQMTMENLYDVVIIDEAHMHDINMDLILTFMRNVVNINNQVKLIITSATMDDDEYIYRRYYKILDDNYGYPISPIIAKLEYVNMYSNLEDEMHVLDKIVVDRRYHISPPGLTTKYKVIDKYLETDTKNYEEAEAAGLKILDEILKRNTTGDVLFFTTTVVSVNSIIEKINKSSPAHAIALPLYADLKNKPGNWFDKIENIDKNLSTFTYSKSQILDVINGNISSPSKIPPGTYTMAIIVATNIVEASVTIPTLRFVIDTGYFNSVAFDDDTSDVSQSIDPIPEASRLQRRGRVGRVAPGTVYYTYAKNSRANIKPRYGIVTADITFDLFKIAHSETEDNIMPIYNYELHPMNFNQRKKKVPSLTWEEMFVKEPNEKIRKIYMNQYSETQTNLNLNSYQMMFQTLMSPFKDGYTIRELFDKYGSFYIVHPDEYSLKRNVVTGEIVRLTNTGTENYYISKKIVRSLKRLIGIKYFYMKKSINSDNIERDYIYIKKFSYYTHIDTILNKEKDSIGYLVKKINSEENIIRIVKTLLVAHEYNCVEDILKILSLLYSIGSYKTFVAKGTFGAKSKTNTKFNDYDNFIKLWSSNESELFSYLKIMNFFIQAKESSDKNEVQIPKTYVEKSFNKFRDLFKIYGNKIYLEKYSQELKSNNIDQSEVINFTQYINTKSNAEKRYNDYVSKRKVKSLGSSEGFNYSKYCDEFFINPQVIKDAIRMYIDLKKLIQKKTFTQIVPEFKQMYPIIKSVSHKENILKCLLESYMGNLCLYSNNKLLNTTTLIETPLPKISLTQLSGPFVFYCIRTKDELLGLTKISKDLIDQVTPYNILDDRMEFLQYEPQNISNITMKYSVDPKESKLININIDGQMQMVKIRKYRLKSI